MEKGMKFVVDQNLGKLARELRMLGYDTLYYRGEETYPLIQLARKEGRMILTRNTKLLPRRPEDKVLRILDDDPLRQLKQLIEEGCLSPDGEEHFTRCLLCNNLLDEIPREEVQGKVPDHIFHHQRRFFQCPECLRVYWKGSHLENMQKRIDDLLEAPMQSEE